MDALSPTSAPQSIAKSTEADEKLRASARSFEAAFLTPMIDEALRTAGKATFGAGQAEEVWRSFLAGAIAEEVAKSETTGIAQSVARQMAAYKE